MPVAVAQQGAENPELALVTRVIDGGFTPRLLIRTPGPPGSRHSCRTVHHMPRPTLFTSYSHKDERWKDRILNEMKAMGLGESVDCWDDQRIRGGDDWYDRIREALGAASLAILIVTDDFLASRFINDEEVPRLLESYRRRGLRLYPIIATSCNWQAVEWLRRLQVHQLSAGSEQQIRADLAAICNEIAALASRVPCEPLANVPLRPDLVEITRLPRYGSHFFGRRTHLERLESAWEDVDGTNIVSVIAWAGVGKSALVQQWLTTLGTNFGGARRVFGWSFDRDGMRTRDAADHFIHTALHWFGDTAPEAGSPWEKGTRLSTLVRRQRTLLVLDGLEPLQGTDGRIHDSAGGVAALIRGLAADNPGLCVVTSRIAILDIEQHRRSTSTVINLEDLSEADGALLLEALGAKGDESERRAASREFLGHAFTLSLLGTFIRRAFHGDIRRRNEVRLISASRRLGSNAEQLMASYESWLGEGTELSVLRMIGLFDRRARREWLTVLRSPPVIRHLTDNLRPLDETEWRLAVANLRDAQLLMEASPEDPDMLDCHPLVRNYFAQRLHEQFPDAWVIGHDRLYLHLKGEGKQFPETLEEMLLLLAAVAHGCNAGRHAEVLNEVYKQRIQRGAQHYCRVDLRAYAADLAALTNFCSPDTSDPLPGLPSRERAYLYNQLAECYWILGQLDRAADCLERALRIYVEEGARPDASQVARDLGELSLVRGFLGKAAEYATTSAEIADSSFAEIRAIATLGMILHQAGRWRDAVSMFHRARRMQKVALPDQPVLPFVHGYYYGDLMLDLNKPRAVIKQGELVLKGVSVGYATSLETPLARLLIGRAEALLAERHPADEAAHCVAAQRHLDEAVDGLRGAGDQSHLARGLIGRAQFWRQMGKLRSAEHDLREALDNTCRSGMKFLQVDCDLELSYVHYARHIEARRDEELHEARRKLFEAKSVMGSAGYRRRDRAVAELQRLLDAPDPHGGLPRSGAVS